MGLRSLVKNNVRQAFRLIDDLAVTATLSRSTTTGFDFNTLVAATTTPQTKIVKGVLVEKKRNDLKDNQNVHKISIIFNSDDVTDFTEFDTVTINNIVYKPAKPFVDNGYTVEVELVRGM